MLRPQKTLLSYLYEDHNGLHHQRSELWVLDGIEESLAPQVELHLPGRHLVSGVVGEDLGAH